MSSVYVICWIFLQTFQTYFCILQANSVNPEQSDLDPQCLQKWLLKSQAGDKADDRERDVKEQINIISMCFNTMGNNTDREIFISLFIVGYT